MNFTPADTVYSDATPQNVAAVGNAGSNGSASRSDHVHALAAGSVAANQLAETYAVIIGSLTGTTSIVGNGADQTVATKAFTALTAGEAIHIVSSMTFTRTAGAGVVTNYTVQLGATNLIKQSASDGHKRINHTTAQVGNSSRGGIVNEEFRDGGTGAAANIVTLNADYSENPAVFNLLAEVPAGTTYSVTWSYHIIKYRTGV